MIYKLKVNDPAKAVLPWWKDVEWLKGRQEIEFGPGLNILFGKNGSGKSTVLTTIAKLLCCYDGDQQLVGQWTTSDMSEWDGNEHIIKMGVVPEHDGSPIMHFDPSQQVGLIGGGAGFDWDFGDAGMQNTMFKGSAGQTCMMRMTRILATALDPKVEWPEVKWKGNHHRPELAELFKGDGNRVRPTLLMDEPSSNLDLMTEIRLFQVLQKIADSGVQVIVATHSVFALHMDDAKYIDTTPAYSTHARVDVEAHFLEKLMAKPKYLEIMQEYVGVVKKDKAAQEPKGLVRTAIGTKSAAIAAIRHAFRDIPGRRTVLTGDRSLVPFTKFDDWYDGPRTYLVVSKDKHKLVAQIELKLEAAAPTC